MVKFEIFLRQSSRTYGLSILECALALMLPNQLPHEIVNEIFSVKFLDRLDTEVEACYSKVRFCQCRPINLNL